MFYRISNADTFNNTVATGSEAETLYKPPTTLATLVAKRSWLGEVYLDWSKFPVVMETGTDPNGITTVSFRDLRFFYNTPLFRGRENTPLSGAVYLNADRRVVAMEMNGHLQD
jgi:inner membrane protein